MADIIAFLLVLGYFTFMGVMMAVSAWPHLDTWFGVVGAFGAALSLGFVVWAVAGVLREKMALRRMHRKKP